MAHFQNREYQPRTYKSRLLKLAALLERLPRKQFNYGEWGRFTKHPDQETVDLCDATRYPLSNDSVHACGTVACALGWAPSLTFARRAGVRLWMVPSSDGKFFYGIFFYGERRIGESEAADELFGLDNTGLFLPSYEYPSSSSPKRVAKRIREFVATNGTLTG